MNVVFFGSSKYSTIVEEALFKKFGLSLVVTLPDRELGRKKILTPNPVKSFAKKNNIPVLTFEKLDKKTVEEILKPIRQAQGRQVQNDKKKKPDFLVVADFGLILPKELLEIPKYAALNVHPSLLPKYRGPTPVQTAILNGEKKTGVTVIKLDKQVDHGPILAQKEKPIFNDETAENLYLRLFEIGAKLLYQNINKYLKGELKLSEQDHSQATFTKPLTRQDGFIDIHNPPSPEIIDRMIRAYYPWPGAWSKWQMPARNASQSETGGANGKWQMVKFLPGQKLQVEGGKPMSLKDFLNGYPEAKPFLQNLFPKI